MGSAENTGVLTNTSNVVTFATEKRRRLLLICARAVKSTKKTQQPDQLLL